jgi:nucleotide-binding universal stress UspA family protein
MYCIAPAEFEYWAGVGELMRAEAREEAEANMAIHASYAHQFTGEVPVLYVREGDAHEELISLINEETQISLLVLGADTQSETAGPLISFMMAKGAANCRVPITVVPGNLSDDQIDALF